MNAFKEFLFTWGLLCVIAAIIELYMLFVHENTHNGSPKSSLWDNICCFFQFFPIFAFYAFLAAIAFTIVDRILTNFSRSYLYGVLW